jgi:hypothetical protein
MSWSPFPHSPPGDRKGKVRLLIGLVGGVALGSAAAARRTESSFPVFLASANPSDLTVESTISYPYPGMPPFASRVRHLHDVRRVESAVEPISDVLQPDGAPTEASLASGFRVAIVGSVDGLYFTHDRVTVTRGRMADPRSPGQFVMSAEAAGLLGLHVGEVVPMGFTPTRSRTPAGSGRPDPAHRRSVLPRRLVQRGTGAECHRAGPDRPGCVRPDRCHRRAAIAAQAIARQIRAGLGDSQVLRGIGAAPAMIAADSLTGSWAQSF